LFEIGIYLNYMSGVDVFYVLFGVGLFVFLLVVSYLVVEVILTVRMFRLMLKSVKNLPAMLKDTRKHGTRPFFDWLFSSFGLASFFLRKR
jgi:hypothetical protein